MARESDCFPAQPNTAVAIEMIFQCAEFAWPFLAKLKRRMAHQGVLQVMSGRGGDSKFLRLQSQDHKSRSISR